MATKFKVVLRKKSEIYKEKEGTYNYMKDEGDKANQSRAEECDIRTMLIKYGCTPDQFRNMATEQLYLNNLGEELSLNEKLKQKEQADEYFETLPAKVRKQFNDNKELFYTGLIKGQYDKYLETGVIDAIQVEAYKKQEEQKQKTITELNTEIENLKGRLNDIQQNDNQENNSVE